MATKTFLKKLDKKIEEAEKFGDLYDIPFELIRPTRGCGKNLEILILNTPCNGFGDLVFAWKLAKILRKYYGAAVKIATTLANGLLSLGEDQNNILRLASSPDASEKNKKQVQCRRYSRLKIFEIGGKKQVDPNKFDLFLDAPVMADFQPEMAGIRRAIKKANYFNSFFFSEYNDDLDKGFDFNTGIGGDRGGIFILPPSMIRVAPKSAISRFLDVQKYGNHALSYIGPWDGWEDCIPHFAQMIAAKYRYKKFQLLTPDFCVELLSENKVARMAFGPYYDRVVFTIKSPKRGLKTIEKDFSKIKGKNKGGTLYVRGDIFPQPNEMMLGLIRHSVKDVLLTGDQSITDALSCCVNKNIFYQIAPWKENLGHYLAKLLPQKYLKNINTACGTLKALKYNSNYTEFVKKWSFIKLGKPKLDRIICVHSMIKSQTPKGKILKGYMDIVNSSRTLGAVDKKWKNFY